MITFMSNITSDQARGTDVEYVNTEVRPLTPTLKPVSVFFHTHPPFPPQKGYLVSFRVEMVHGAPGRLAMRVTRGANYDVTSYPARLVLAGDGGGLLEAWEAGMRDARFVPRGVIPAHLCPQVVPALAALARRAAPAVELVGPFPAAPGAPPAPPAVHGGVVCNGCGAEPIVGIRFKCAVCPNVDLCAPCFGRAAYEGGGHAPAAHAMHALPLPLDSLRDEHVGAPCTMPGCGNRTGAKYRCMKPACQVGIWCEACELARRHDTQHPREKQFPPKGAAEAPPAPVVRGTASGAGGGGGGGGGREAGGRAADFWTRGGSCTPMVDTIVGRQTEVLATMLHFTSGFSGPSARAVAMPHFTSGFRGFR
jgi:hypothetical protein